MAKLDLRNVILDFSSQFKKAIGFAANIGAKGNFNKLVVCGMGGSALPADIIRTFLESKGISLPIFVSRTYNLPLQADKNSLVFISSYSGDTEEVSACFEKAKSTGLIMVGFAKGGKLEKLCQENDIPFVKYPDDGPDFQPRFGLGYATCAMLLVLINSGVIPDFKPEIEGLIADLNPSKYEAQGRELAQKSKNIIPIFYSSERYKDSVARICKIIINENGKTLSFFNAFPELNHNELVGYTIITSKLHVIIIKDTADHERILKRMQITREILAQKQVLVSEIEMEGDSTLKKIFNTLTIIFWMSYYLAKEYGIDPIPVAMVEEFKKKME